MSALLERYERQARILRPRSRIRDVEELAALEAQRWKALDNELRETSDLTALAGGFAGLEVNPPPLALPPVTLGATELALWPVATWTPIAAMPQAPKGFRLAAFGQMTTAATPGTNTLTPRIGAANSSPTLGASPAIVPVASDTTTNWILRGDLIIRIAGGASTATAIGMFHFFTSSATTTAGTIAQAGNVIFGGTVASFDSTITQALWLGGSAATSTTNTMTPLGILWASWN